MYLEKGVCGNSGDYDGLDFDASFNAIADHYRHSHANVHRGVYTLSAEATEQYEGTRVKVAPKSVSPPAISIARA